MYENEVILADYSYSNSIVKKKEDGILEGSLTMLRLILDDAQELFIFYLWQSSGTNLLPEHLLR